MKWFYAIGSVVWMGLAIMSWVKNDSEMCHWAFLMFWLMVIMGELTEIKQDMKNV